MYENNTSFKQPFIFFSLFKNGGYQPTHVSTFK